MEQEVATFRLLAKTLGEGQEDEKLRLTEYATQLEMLAARKEA